MGTLFYYIGFPEEVNVFVGDREVDLVHATLVYRSDNDIGSVGFDADTAGIELVQKVFAGGLHYETDSQEYSFLPADAEEIIHKVRKWPTATLLGIPNELSRLRDQVTRFRKIERQNDIRARFGKELVEIPQSPLLLGLLQNGHKALDLQVTAGLSRKLGAIVKWRITDFGLHFYYVSREMVNLDDSIVRLRQQKSLQLTQCDSEREIPVR